MVEKDKMAYVDSCANTVLNLVSRKNIKELLRPKGSQLTEEAAGALTAMTAVVEAYLPTQLDELFQFMKLLNEEDIKLLRSDTGHLFDYLRNRVQETLYRWVHGRLEDYLFIEGYAPWAEKLFPPKNHQWQIWYGPKGPVLDMSGVMGNKGGVVLHGKMGLSFLNTMRTCTVYGPIYNRDPEELDELVLGGKRVIKPFRICVTPLREDIDVYSVSERTLDHYNMRVIDE